MANGPTGSVTERIASLARQAIAGEPITRTQAEWLTSLDSAYLDDKLRQATRIREHFFGNRVRCCSIVAAAVGRCSEDCAFCSQSAHYQTPVVEPGQLDIDQVVHASLEAANSGAQCFGIVNSGYAPADDEIEHWGDAFRRIRAAGRPGLCASLGVLTGRQARRLAQLGVQRYNHNLQTSRRHFPHIVTTHTYDDRLATLAHLKAAGVTVCSGALFGMGETWTDRLDLAFTLREIKPDVIPINFLIPIAGTPLAKLEPLPAHVCLDILAVFRFLFPQTEIKVAGGREASLGTQQPRMFDAGANGFLIGNYLTTSGQSPADDHQMIRQLGLALDSDAPFRMNSNNPL